MTREAKNEVTYYLFTECMVEDELCSFCQWTTCSKSSHSTLQKLLYTSVLSLLIGKTWGKDRINLLAVFYCVFYKAYFCHN